MLNRAPADLSGSRGNGVERLNAVALTGAELEAALRAIAALPGPEQRDPVMQSLMLQAFVERANITGGVAASAALHARMTALDAWTRDHDPNRDANAEAVMEAAARQPLVETDGGIGFEPVSFSELILFVEQLPF